MVSPMASYKQQESYIYCIQLPFRCTSMTLDAMLRPGKHLLPPPQSVWVAKVGITINPAERLYDIFNAFQELGEPQPLLRSLSRSDDAKTAITKAKSMNEIVFIEKVHDHAPENAEHNIRAILQIGDPKLTKEFFVSFEASVPREKKVYLDGLGMKRPEWITMSANLAGMLQKKFRGGGIYEFGIVKVPNGEELTRAVKDFCDKYFQIASSKGPTRDSFIIAMGGPRPPLKIEFNATSFIHTA